MSKIIFINRFFYPDHSATSQMLTDLVFGLVEGIDDEEIHIVTSRQQYDTPDALLEKYELINKVHVHRIWTSRFGRQNLLGRVVDYLSFYISSIFILFGLTKKNDIVVAKTDPPLISVIAAGVAKVKGAHLYNWLQDLFPEVAAELGMKFARGWPYTMLKKVRNKTLMQAKSNIVIGKAIANKLRSEGIPDDKITIIHNWADEDQIKLVSHEQNTLRYDWGLSEKFVVGYSGNLGRSHDFSTILAAAESLKNNDDIRFLLIGGGAQLESIKQECIDRKLSNIVFKPYQPRDMLSESLSVSDIHLISLKPELEGLILPCKFYGILAVGRPVIFIGAEDGEIAEVVKKESCGYSITQGDTGNLIESILKEINLLRNTEDGSKKIRKLFDDSYSKKRAITEFAEVFRR